MNLPRLALFASGSGSNAEKIVEYFRGHPTVSVDLILCNNPQAGVIARADRLGVPLVRFDRAQFRSGEVLEVLRKHEIEYLVLAGFLWLVPSIYVEAYPDRILNLHPALLPKFGGKGMYGHHVHEAVVAAGERESGITIHLVNERYDDGAIVFQAAFPVAPTDTPDDVARKGQALEHEHFPRVIEEFVTKKELPGTGLAPA